jgi:hypothetical protein
MAAYGIPEPGEPIKLGAFFLEDRRFPAVYFLYSHGLLVYVGQTRTLKFRVDNHFSTAAKVFDSIAFIRCTIDQLLRIESHYIRKFAPKYNACAIAQSVRENTPWRVTKPQGGISAAEAADFLGVSHEQFAHWQTERIGPKEMIRRVSRSRSRQRCGYNIQTLRDFAKDHPDMIAAAKAA